MRKKDNGLSIITNFHYISEKIKGLNEKNGLTVLKDLNPTDLSLMNLFLQALKKEDYETCAVVKALLLEREFKITNNLLKKPQLMLNKSL